MRISTTTLESYRLYRDADFMEEAELLSSIRGEFKPTPEVRKGLAFHKVLETPDRFWNGKAFVCDGIAFPGEVVSACLEKVDRSGVFEVKATREYRVGRQTVTVVSKADQAKGLELREHKTRWDTYEADRYALSYQWRFYLDVFGALSVTYVVFLLSEYKSGEIGLRGIESLTLYPYPALHDECSELLADFVGYIKARKLERYFKDLEAA